MADPKTFLDRYTNLTFTNPLDNTKVTVQITAYGAGWEERDKGNGPQGPDCQSESQKFQQAVNKALNGNAFKPSGKSFQFDKTPLANIPATQTFTEWGFVKAFLGKGSPDDIAATLRVGMAVGRIGTGKDANGLPAAAATPAQYVGKFISLDCNGFTGNFLGTNPETRPRTYAVAARCRRMLSEVQQGDVAVTFTLKGEAEHIALIQSWSASPASADGKRGTCSVAVVEWGERGDESKHFHSSTANDFAVGPNNDFPDKFPGIYFVSSSAKDPTTNKSLKIRYIFAPP
jgi:hypothetical protein